MVQLIHLYDGVLELVRHFILSREELTEFMRIFEENLDNSLKTKPETPSCFRSFVSNVNKIGTGEERGQYVGLTFEGSPIKISLIVLQDKEAVITTKIYDIPEEYQTGSSCRLFRFIADCLADFLQGLKIKWHRIPVTVTMGFKIDLISFQKCIFLEWSKGFSCKDAIGRDVYKMLNTCIKNHPALKYVYLIGIISTNVNEVLACSWNYPNTKVHAVIGTPLSFTYAEKISKVENYKTETYSISEVLVQFDSSTLGDDGCLEYFKTDYDRMLDEDTENPGKETLKKLIGKKYLPEICRLIVEDLINRKLILKGVIKGDLSKKYGLSLQQMSDFEHEYRHTSHVEMKKYLKSLGYQPEEMDPEFCHQIRFVARCVFRRAADLLGCQLAVILNRMKAPMVGIKIRSNFVENYYYFKWYLEKTINIFRNKDYGYYLVNSKDDEIPQGQAVFAAIYGPTVMDMEEKRRQLPGFPMNRCHFSKKDSNSEPVCENKYSCPNTFVNTEQVTVKISSKDIFPLECFKKKSKPRYVPCLLDNKEDDDDLD